MRLNAAICIRGGVSLSFCLTAASGICFAGREPDADKILRAMSSYLGGLKNLEHEGRS